ncbi:putative 50S ribosomal protein [Babesia sp. Xinjiang]|uniref:putative 50S ribosomal protein n=1 Tax=Babesia sp. Xinjiang TaxID=462227 RepID=UPI000A253BE6|nr:putative 50S ribosomal protein [Babesia sp. Xinjiang]ORM40596.1 putative 50S ribosomal protein [Babesia sp. Xinjiang]
MLISVALNLVVGCWAFATSGRAFIAKNIDAHLPYSPRKWELQLTKRSELMGHPKPRKLHKRPFWADMFDEEVEVEPLGPPCPKLMEDVVRGERRLRLTLKRSNRQMSATIVDDVSHTVHCFISTNFKYLAHIFGQEPTNHPMITRNKGGNVRAAYELGKLIGRQARAKGISRVVFDRAGYRDNYRYHGRVEALAIGARKVGLDF